jgi:hypothetical protein
MRPDRRRYRRSEDDYGYLGFSLSSVHTDLVELLVEDASGLFARARSGTSVREFVAGHLRFPCMTDRAKVTSARGARRLSDGRGIVKVSETTQRILNGTEDLSVWSEEELTRGVRRGKDGKFRNKPKVIPHAVHQELVKRRMSRAYDLLRESTYDAVKVLVEVAKDENADTAVRVKAAELILDRALGKAPQHVSVDVNAPWRQLMAQAIVASVDPPGADEEVVDGELVEDARP